MHGKKQSARQEYRALAKLGPYHTVNPKLARAMGRPSKFFLACQSGNVSEFEEEIASNQTNLLAFINQKGPPLSSTALHMAARNGQLAIVQRLVALGADIYAKDATGVNPLESTLLGATENANDITAAQTAGLRNAEQRHMHKARGEQLIRQHVVIEWLKQVHKERTWSYQTKKFAYDMTLGFILPRLPSRGKTCSTITTALAYICCCTRAKARREDSPTAASPTAISAALIAEEDSARALLRNRRPSKTYVRRPSATIIQVTGTDRESHRNDDDNDDEEDWFNSAFVENIKARLAFKSKHIAMTAASSSAPTGNSSTLSTAASSARPDDDGDGFTPILTKTQKQAESKEERKRREEENKRLLEARLREWERETSSRATTLERIHRQHKEAAAKAEAQRQRDIAAFKASRRAAEARRASISSATPRSSVEPKTTAPAFSPEEISFIAYLKGLQHALTLLETPPLDFLSLSNLHLFQAHVALLLTSLSKMNITAAEAIAATPYTLALEDFEIPVEIYALEFRRMLYHFASSLPTDDPRKEELAYQYFFPTSVHSALASNTIQHTIIFKLMMQQTLASVGERVLIAGTANIDPLGAHDLDLIITGKPGQSAAATFAQIYEIFNSLQGNASSGVKEVKPVPYYNQIRFKFSIIGGEELEVDVTCLDHDPDLLKRSRTHLLSPACVYVDLYTGVGIAPPEAMGAILEERLCLIRRTEPPITMRDSKLLTKTAIRFCGRLQWEVDESSFNITASLPTPSSEEREVVGRCLELCHAAYATAQSYFSARYAVAQLPPPPPMASAFFPSTNPGPTHMASATEVEAGAR